MGTKKRVEPRIPAGAPGHGKAPAPAPRAGSAPRHARDAERREPRKAPPAARPAEVGGRASLRFLHEDRDILVVEKPAGLPSIAAEGSRGRSAYDLVTERIRERNPVGRAAVVHRLDRDTSGVMVFAANARAKKTLMEGWKELVTERSYVALVEGDTGAEEGRLESWLAPEGTSRMRLARKGEDGALRAVSVWRRLARGAGYSLLELSLETGRKHQIRVQLAAAGWPVAGDTKYGARSDPAGRLMLHARVIEFRHPTSGEPLRFECPEPREFRQALREPRSWGAKDRLTGGEVQAAASPAAAKAKPVPRPSAGKAGKAGPAPAGPAPAKRAKTASGKAKPGKAKPAAAPSTKAKGARAPKPATRLPRDR